MRPRITLLLATSLVAIVGISLLPAKTAVQDPGEPKDLARYFVVIKKNGPKRDQSPELAAKIQADHLTYLKAKRDEGVVLIGGPFDDDSSDWRSISIINAASEEEARRAAAQDPAVLAGRLVFEVHAVWFPKSDFERAGKKVSSH
jgi:uncharacterized protein YciI